MAKNSNVKMTHEEAISIMNNYILCSFNKSFSVKQDEKNSRILRVENEFDNDIKFSEIITIVQETKKDRDDPLNSVINSLDEIIIKNSEKKIGTTFLFLRCWTDYNEMENYNLGFLRQKLNDNYNVRTLTKLELAVEQFYFNGTNRFGFGSRIVYFDPKKECLQSMNFKDNSLQHRLQYGHNCINWCKKEYYFDDEKIIHERCKEDFSCTVYAWGREKRIVKINPMRTPLKLEVKKKGNLYLAYIK
jgi:hypothetical protein